MCRTPLPITGGRHALERVNDPNVTAESHLDPASDRLYKEVSLHDSDPVQQGFRPVRHVAHNVPMTICHAILLMCAPLGLP
jgi:hypothetical protein